MREGELRRAFRGLEIPPIVTSDQPGRHFVLHSRRAGSLEVGTPVYSLQVVSASEGALFDTDEAALEYRAPKAPADTDWLRIDYSIVWTASGLGFENRDAQTAFDEAWQKYESGMALRLKPTRRFPQTTYLTSVGAAFYRYATIAGILALLVVGGAFALLLA